MSSGRTRVLYLAHTLAIGGAEEMVLNLVRHLPPRFEPVVMCIDRPGPIGEEVAKTGVGFTSLGLQPGMRRPLDVLRLQRAIEERAPMIVHTFLLTASLYGRFAAMLARVPVVIGTEVNIYERKQELHRVAEGWLMRHTDVVVTSADSVRKFYIEQIGAAPEKVAVIYNAVDWSQLKMTESRAQWRAQVGVPQDAVVGGIIARLTEQKAHRVLFEAIASRAELASLHLVVVGDGELRDDLRQRVDQLGLSSRVHFTGARRDLGNILGSIDMFVMPSLWEGLPLSMVLAMGAGLPVIASNVAGIPEVVVDNATGRLVNPGDVAQLAGAIATLVNDPAARQRLGAAARESVMPRFGVDHYVDSVVELYDRLLAAKHLS